MYVYVYMCVYIYIYIPGQMARDVGGVDVGGVKGMLFGMQCTSCTNLRITCVFMLYSGTLCFI